MTMFTKDFIQRYSGLMVFFSLIIINPAPSVASIEASPSTGDTSSIDSSTNIGGEKTNEWEYLFEDRPDPFFPFIQPAVATLNIPDEDEVILTGMQLFEPGQLKLVAIMFSPDKKIAMVEDVTGKGYVIDEGTLIGRHGIISKINLDQVNITETRKVAGKEIVTPVVMRLNKEGDQ